MLDVLLVHKAAHDMMSMSPKDTLERSSRKILTPKDKNSQFSPMGVKVISKFEFRYEKSAKYSHFVW